MAEPEDLIESLREAIRKALAKCPVCGGTELKTVEDCGVSWEEPCDYCGVLREALEASDG